ncbi:ribosome small subunit-dependent GTPase A [Anaerotignum lactatifermentans]|uniref:Small ribosomal subunit biogenesis GTPase RsgA n=1 Tax=Anaerotignum lactatifermentans TaxID=160404 RepID=A0ABS2GB42_9FIRM|nr:ribosome small subunit-dependent GTPase A [Anaerotignum lactatifermentans]MBM6830156.1 ribosome small subunit-dependent GTPase A [Anaerotignum lactatifermentans]MBM6878699.1 ribosome small subunit-dependent GTPase A [Anaerotignum lactatifermentans]MBM6951769.1 ribosome small subunit-dependent GTPase A [Anaerotignum lactatifermentans]
MTHKGVILKGIGGFYYVDTENGVYECRARGIFRKEGIRPTVGDDVEISVLDEKNKKGSLDVIFPRRNELIRPRVANVDQAVIVFAAKSPNMNLDLLDRFLVLAEEQELEIVLVINKIDRDKQGRYEEAAVLYRAAGYPVVCTSAEKGIGIEELREVLKNKISVFAGPSGVGKSSLINSAFPGLSLNTGEISEKIQRGRHTTRHAELIQVSEQSYIVDSPGFTSLFLNHIPAEKLQYYFREFAPYVHECYYNGCMHINEPDCAVKEQIGKAIDSRRYERYKTLFEELENERRM